MKTLLVSIDDLDPETHETAETPYIDSLLASWWTHDRFVAAPNCSNFRAKVETGLYSVRPNNYVGGIFRSTSEGSLPIGPHLLAQQIGCSSVHIGKWHLCQHDDLDHRGRAGYVSYAGSQANLNPGTYFDFEAVIDGEVFNVTEYATLWTARLGSRALLQNKDFVHLSFNAIHKPFHSPPGTPEYGQVPMLEYLDTMLSRLIPIAVANGYAIIFTTDNGGTVENGGKGTLLHQALAVPFAVYGFVPEPRPVIDTTDIYATVIHLLNGEPPTGCDGISLLDASQTREIAFADKFAGVLHPPGANAQDTATDGVLKVRRDHETGEVFETDWFDEPVPGSEFAHLHAALEAR